MPSVEQKASSHDFVAAVVGAGVTTGADSLFLLAPMFVAAVAVMVEAQDVTSVVGGSVSAMAEEERNGEG